MESKTGLLNIVTEMSCYRHAGLTELMLRFMLPSWDVARNISYSVYVDIMSVLGRPKVQSVPVVFQQTMFRGIKSKSLTRSYSWRMNICIVVWECLPQLHPISGF